MSLLSQVSLYSDHTRRTILGPAWSDHVVLATIVSNVRIGVSQDTSSNKTLILSATTATSHNVNTAECPISVSLLPIIYSSIGSDLGLQSSDNSVSVVIGHNSHLECNRFFGPNNNGEESWLHYRLLCYRYFRSSHILRIARHPITTIASDPIRIVIVISPTGLYVRYGSCSCNVAENVVVH
jgi:hypothetical protein